HRFQADLPLTLRETTARPRHSVEFTDSGIGAGDRDPMSCLTAIGRGSRLTAGASPAALSIVILYVFVNELLEPSATSTTTRKSPACVGVPLSTPDASTVTPGGRSDVADN